MVDIPTQNVSNSYLRMDMSNAMAYTGPEMPHLSGWQKFTRGLAKVVNFVGPIGSAVLQCLGPFGLIGAGAAYGVTKLSQDLLYKAQMKDQILASSQPQPTSYAFTGLMDSTPISAGDVMTDFMVPSSMEPKANETVMNRQYSIQDSLNSF